MMRALVVVVLVAGTVGTVGAGAAAEPARGTLRLDREIASSRELSLEVGQNKLLESSVPLGRVAVANPDVADLNVVASTQVLVTAKNVGDTYLTLWDKADQPIVLSLHVTRNLDALRKQVQELFPDENISISAAGDLVVLTGDVSDVRIPERVVSVAKLQAPKLANLLHVRGNQQVQLEVKFAEVSRTGLREMGFNWFHSTNDRVAGMVSPNQPVGDLTHNSSKPVLGSNVPGIPDVYQSSFSNAFSLFFSGLGNFPFSVVVSLLEQNQLAKTLAEPTLVAMTGQEARFLAGGEFPIPLASGFGTVQVEFKKFGIQLKFTPTVLSEGLINLKLATEVSEIDNSLSVTIGGSPCPG
jgi:pilus assembly protein CpaC